MAGTLTVERLPRAMPQSGKKLDIVKVSWTSDASGNADVSISDLYGYILRLVTDPTDGPTASYDITLVDEFGVDALEGAGADRHTTNNESVYPTKSGAATPVFVCGDATFTVANAGNAKSGVAYLVLCESL